MSYRHWTEREGMVCRMWIVATDQFKGSKFRCPCGWGGWTIWGHARKHAETCNQAWGDAA